MIITSHMFAPGPAGCRFCPYPASWHDPAAPAYRPGRHTCVAGPLCAQEAQACSDGYEYRADHTWELDPAGRPCCPLPAGAHPPGECSHDSCLEIVHEFCLECFTEAMLETGR